MPQLQVPIVRTGSLPYDCIPPDPNQFFQDIVDRIIGMLSVGFTGVIISDTAPGANDRDKLWVDTNNNDSGIYRWVTDIGGFTGWARRHPIEPSSTMRRWFDVSADADLVTEDGGDAGPLNGVATGPFWIRDTNYDGRVPLAEGTIPTSDPVISVAPGDTGGAQAHTLTQAEGALGTHQHPFGKSFVGDSQGIRLAQQGLTSTPSFQTLLAAVGGAIGVHTTETTADMWTLPPVDSSGKTPATPDQFSLMNPYRVGIWARRSGRVWILPS